MEEEIKSLINTFDHYGNPEENSEIYINFFGKDKLNYFIDCYKAYNGGIIDEFVSASNTSRIKIYYRNDIKSLISEIKNDKNLELKESVFIANEINNIDDLELLKSTFPDKKIVMIYNNELAFIDDIISSIYMINYFKSIVDDDLSPLEKITIIYDIVKSHIYKEYEQKKHSTLSRYITKMVNNDYIVCIGYVNIFNKVLKELGFETFVLELSEKKDNKVTYHSRSLVRINDPKYNINNYFVFDPTWDSDNNAHIKLVNDKYDIDYESKEGYKKADSLSSYKFFLIPLNLYERKFSNSFNEKLDSDGKKVQDPKVIKRLFHENQINNSSYYLPIDCFVKIINIAKIKEGYPENTIPSIIQESLILSDYGFLSAEEIKNIIKENEIIK